MATEAQPVGGCQQVELSNELASQWRRLTRAATAVALLTAPAVVGWLNQTQGWSWFWSILAALALVVCFRGVIDILFHRLIPRPSLFGLESPKGVPLLRRSIPHVLSDQIAVTARYRGLIRPPGPYGDVRKP